MRGLLHPGLRWCRDDGRFHSRMLDCHVAAILVWYCRSLIAASAKQALSPEVRDVTGIARAASGKTSCASCSSCSFVRNARKTAAASRRWALTLAFWISCAQHLHAWFLRCVPGQNRSAAVAPILPLSPLSAASPSAAACSRSRWKAKPSAQGSVRAAAISFATNSLCSLSSSLAA